MEREIVGVWVGVWAIIGVLLVEARVEELGIVCGQGGALVGKRGGIRVLEVFGTGELKERGVLKVGMSGQNIVFVAGRARGIIAGGMLRDAIGMSNSAD